MIKLITKSYIPSNFNQIIFEDDEIVPNQILEENMSLYDKNENLIIKN